MNSETVRVSITEEEDRFSRLRLISWWDQEKLAKARVLVIGAGALGNEILKNLALLGFRQVVVVDLDTIETSNLSRSVLFRDSDVGSTKASAAAKGYRDLLPDAVVQPLVTNIVRDGGLGLFAWADLVLAGLDNREARLWINRACWKLNRPWIDGAIEGINGVARVFLPGKAPCYECTLGETDWAILDRRMSCNLLLHAEEKQGRTPTTPTISSIIAGVQVQESVKLLHDMPVLASKGFVFEGLHHTSYVVSYTENPDCMSHYTLDRMAAIHAPSEEIFLGELFDLACKDLGTREITLEFSRDVIQALECPQCGKAEEIFRPVGSVSYEQGRCPDDGSMRVVRTMSGYRGEERLRNRRLSQLGIPPFDVFTARSLDSEISYLIAGDSKSILGPLADPWLKEL